MRPVSDRLSTWLSGLTSRGDDSRWPGRVARGFDPAALTDLLAARFVCGEPGGGVAISTVAQGGYRSNSLLTLHPDSGPAFRELRPDMVLIMLGANDPGNYHEPAVYRDHMRNLIAWVREWTRADMPVVVFSDAPRTGFDARQRAYDDRYPGVNFELASEDPLVCAINMRLRLEQIGWTSATLPTYCIDQVHDNANGAAVKAREDVAALFSLLEEPCDSDFNGDGFTDLFDYDQFVECFEGGACPPGRTADFNGDGFTDFFDFDTFAAAFEGVC